MGKELRAFAVQIRVAAKQELKNRLALLEPKHHEIFKKIYAFRDHERLNCPDMSMTIDEVVDNLPDNKLEWALEQTARTIEALGLNYVKSEWVISF